MAVATQRLVMGPSEGRNVHPFFSLSKDKSKSLSTSTNTTNVSSSAGPELPNPTLDQAVQPQALNAGHEQPSNAQLPLPAPAENNRKSIEKVDRTASKEKRTPHSVETSRTSSNGYGNISGQENTTINVQSHTSGNGTIRGLDIRSTDLEVDPNDGRRKRQRTTSPIQGSSSVEFVLGATWEDQLKAAAQKSEDVISVAELRYNELTIDAKGSSLEPGAGEKTSLIPHRAESSEHSNPILKGLDQQSKQDLPVKNGTPKKKMLKLRNDGKLISPIARPGTSASKQTVSPKKRGRKRIIRTKIIILKYGVDLKTRETTGLKIQAILDRRVPENAMLAEIKHTHDKQMPREPLKPTHPFFLGKSIDKNDITSSKTVTPENDAQALPTNSTSTQKKAPMITPDAAKAWAALGGLGHRSSARESAKLTRFPGTMEPLLPARDMQHVRGVDTSHVRKLRSAKAEEILRHKKKLKDSVVQIHSTEDVLCPLRRFYNDYTVHAQANPNFNNKLKVLRKPQRRLMTGQQLQEALRPNVIAELPSTTELMTTEANISAASAVSPSTSTHSALINTFNGIVSSFTAFDSFQCESQDWVQKYSPKRAAHVLQQGREAVHLRDWLQSLTVVSTDTGNTFRAYDPGLSSKPVVKPKRKRRRAEELDGFVISSDEETNDMDVLTDPEEIVPTSADVFGPKKSMIRNGGNLGLSTTLGASSKASNAVVISGPHGCGKTAAVYAAAQELGFEVFEINAGSRRSGKDLLDKVGDVARNHLVHQQQDIQSSKDPDVLQSAMLQEDIKTGHQSTMQSFLKSKRKGQVNAKRPSVSDQTTKPPDSPKKKQAKQKQSLILLEEVDILFEEDKQFWVTTLALISQSRRPVIMTCTDESRLPFDEMVLHAIFRLSPPSEQLAIDYLVLMAGNEGHILSRDSVIMLYKSRNCDLRASISELNFWCQMAIGDTKGGLEWMLIRSNMQESHNEQGQALRVVSDGTYLEGMGFSGRDRVYDGIGNDVSDEIEMVSDLVREWDYDIEDWCNTLDSEVVNAHGFELSLEQCRRALAAFTVSSDLLSAADTLPNIGSRGFNSVSQFTLVHKKSANICRPVSTCLNQS